MGRGAVALGRRAVGGNDFVVHMNVLSSHSMVCDRFLSFSHTLCSRSRFCSPPLPLPRSHSLPLILPLTSFVSLVLECFPLCLFSFYLSLASLLTTPRCFLSTVLSPTFTALYIMDTRTMPISHNEHQLVDFYLKHTRCDHISPSFQFRHWGSGFVPCLK